VHVQWLAPLGSVHDDRAGKISFRPTDLAGLGLGEAFRKVVIADPEFEVLRKAALSADPLFDFLYLHQHDHIWPVCPSRVSRILNAESAGRFRCMDQFTPILAATARLDALCLAFGDLFRNRKLETVGHLVAHGHKTPVSLHPMVIISADIWAQERFCFHDLAGDIFEHTVPAPEPGKPTARRWTGVVVQWPATAQSKITTLPDNVCDSGRQEKFSFGVRSR
jgi:hypothetical protein